MGKNKNKKEPPSLSRNSICESHFSLPIVPWEAQAALSWCLSRIVGFLFAFLVLDLIISKIVLLILSGNFFEQKMEDASILYRILPIQTLHP
jgi:hypothetical protein